MLILRADLLAVRPLLGPFNLRQHSLGVLVRASASAPDLELRKDLQGEREGRLSGLRRQEKAQKSALLLAGLFL